jgi:hypothetical protein
MTLCDDLRNTDGLGEEFSVEPVEAYLVERAEERPAEAGVDSWVLSLRRSLDLSQGRLKEHEAARELGFCTRTLQRHLRSRGTTFRAEAKAARSRSLWPARALAAPKRQPVRAC